MKNNLANIVFTLLISQMIGCAFYQHYTYFQPAIETDNAVKIPVDIQPMDWGGMTGLKISCSDRSLIIRPETFSRFNILTGPIIPIIPFPYRAQPMDSICWFELRMENYNYKDPLLNGSFIVKFINIQTPISKNLYVNYYPTNQGINESTQVFSVKELNLILDIAKTPITCIGVPATQSFSLRIQLPDNNIYEIKYEKKRGFTYWIFVI